MKIYEFIASPLTSILLFEHCSCLAERSPKKSDFSEVWYWDMLDMRRDEQKKKNQLKQMKIQKLYSLHTYCMYIIHFAIISIEYNI